VDEGDRILAVVKTVSLKTSPPCVYEEMEVSYSSDEKVDELG
jgi:hypothetical protein